MPVDPEPTDTGRQEPTDTGRPEPAGLSQLDASDLAALRLAAQVMAHKAELSYRPRVVLYFDSLEAAIMAEQAARSQGGDGAQRPAEGVPALLAGAPAADDRRLIGEYLGLLVGNERLSTALRELCRDLRARAAE